MMKKIISLVCCLLPVGAVADTVPVAPADGVSVSTTQSDWQNAIAAGDSILINSGNGIVSDGGFSISNNVYIGRDDQGSQSGDLYVTGAAKNNPFTIASDGAVSVGAMLHVLDGWQLGVQRYVGTNPFNVTIGTNATGGRLLVGDTVNGGASMTVTGAGAFTVNGGIETYGDLSVNSGTFTSGAITQNFGNLDIDTTGATTVAAVTALAGNVDINAKAGITSSGTLQNGAGVMNLTTDGAIAITGDLDSKGTGTTVSATSLTVSNTIINDAGSDMVLNVDALTVNGGTQTSGSFINKGNMYVTVEGQTYVENGFALAGMNADNVFSLDTNTLEFGSGVDANVWAQTFSNSLKNFNLAIRGGDLDLSSVSADIVNGANGATGANMMVAANNVSVQNITNNGAVLRVVAAEEFTGELPDLMPTPSVLQTKGVIEVDEQIVTAENAKTDIISSYRLSASDVSNQGTTTLSSAAITLDSVVNSGANSVLDIKSLTDATGEIDINQDVTNNGGVLTINAKDVSVTGSLVANGGVLNVKASDTAGAAVNIGGINAAGGVVNIDALAGAVDVQNVFSVGENGALNFGPDVVDVNSESVINIYGNLTASADAATGGGDVNVSKIGDSVEIVSYKMPGSGTYISGINVGGDVVVADSENSRSLVLGANDITVGGDVAVSGKGALTFGYVPGGTPVATAFTDIDGDVNVTSGGQLTFYSNNISVGSLYSNALVTTGENTSYIVADQGDIEIDGNVYMNGETDAAGLMIGADSFTLGATANGADVSVNSLFVGAGRSLDVNAKDAVTVDGVLNNSGTVDIEAGGTVLVNGAITTSDELIVDGTKIGITGDVTNSGVAKLNAADGSVVMGILSSSGSEMVVSAATEVLADAIEQSSGTMDINAQTLSSQSLVVKNSGTVANLNVSDVNVLGNVNVAGDFAQGGDGTSMLNFAGDDFYAANLTIGGDFVVNSGTARYKVGSNANVSGDVTIASGADVVFDVTNMFEANNLTNDGAFDLTAKKGIDLQNVVNNSGQMSLDSGNTYLNVSSLAVNGGNVLLSGAGAYIDSALSPGAMLYQNYAGDLLAKDINILSDEYDITVDSLTVSGINQKGVLTVNTDSIDVSGDVVANDLRFVLRKDADGNPVKDSSGNIAWLSAEIDGNVSGGVDFIGLDKMVVGKNYTFDSNSTLNAAILPYATGAGSSDINYWSKVSLAQDNTLGEITNASDGAALVQVGGVFTSGVAYDENAFSGNNVQSELANGRIGISLFDAVDQGTAIWLVHADGGVENFGQLEQLRNLNVNFCNADGSICYDYLTSLKDENDTDEDLPAYISVRDSDEDGKKDSLYVVFDPRFGGPILLENMKIQPIVAREPGHTDGEYVSAGALDDLLVGQMHKKKFLNSTPIEVIPLVFEDTNMEQMANELYNRMEYYVESTDATGLARFSRLFQVREIEQIVGGVALNEHTTFRSFEDRMFDEFIWNRNRNPKKAWLDVDYGMFFQNIDDGKHTDGNRFSVSGGFDWQESDTLVLGLTGRVSRTMSDSHDAMDLGYLPGQSISGNVNIDVTDTSVAFGAYLMKILGEKTRLYGNAFMDLHLFDVDRTQNFVGRIDGDGSAFSLISEWGLMHDILNQYVVGNLYARMGYNFGFNVKEKVEGDDYMRLRSDGYFILTPGYSLTAQKRIYPSAWFQIRPYASIGVEYDVAGIPDSAQYKFAPSDGYTDYDVDINPLWANIGGGVEMLSANGVQFGIDYRYQYNSDIQLHNIRVSGSYRF